MYDDQATELEALEGLLSDPSAEPIKLSYGLLKFITGNFSNEIGRGGFGVVYQGTLQNGEVAVKKISSVHEFSDKVFMDEIMCLKRAKHKNIVRFLGYCSESQGEVMEYKGTYVMAEVQKRLLCFEYVPKGNIQDYLEEKLDENDWLIRYQIIKGICEGLHYLHEERISHLDLKPENVMLDAFMEPKITDFGLARCLVEGQSKVYTKIIRGTPGYIAPENINTGEISLKSDIYALGIIIIKLLTGQNVIDFDNWYESIGLDSPQVRGCIEIARDCIKVDQDKRPTIGEIIRELHKIDSMMTYDTGSSTPQFAMDTRSDKLEDLLSEAFFPEARKSWFSAYRRLEVHPSKPWIMTLKTDAIYIWDYQTKQKIKLDVDEAHSAKFIARKRWLVIGRRDSIHVYTCPTFDQVEIVRKFDVFERELRDVRLRRCYTEVVVHPTSPYLLSYCHDSYDGPSMKLWNWDQNWSCTRTFDITSPTVLVQIMVNTKDTNTFATLDQDDRVKIWKFAFSQPIATLEGLKGTSMLENIFTYRGGRHLITAIFGSNAVIWDPHTEKCVHTLSIYDGRRPDDKIVAVVCHPKRPVLVTASKHRYVHVWDCNTYRLKKEYVNLSREPRELAFLSSGRLVILYDDGVEITDTALE
ncbi:RAC-beta serine/threonine-protein kinase A-like isoform X3 [Triticum aestivum]|uniref:RAC-beta serine/threonine-protein kinase A-like isoform X3 n=1 Tax=Triticum aestivum TaxID=4565 RepID=UPI001D012BC7|nr:RAC-beta serine/threonine-protein kinase A-like isoform X3 [Triticum aestivum]